MDNGAAVNIQPYSSLRKLSKCIDDLIHSDVTISDFTGTVNRTRGILPVEITVGSQTTLSAFFVVDASSTYNALLGRDWIHSSWCAPSTLHQVLVFLNGGKVKVVAADDKPFQADSNAVQLRLGTTMKGLEPYGLLEGIGMGFILYLKIMEG